MGDYKGSTCVARKNMAKVYSNTIVLWDWSSMGWVDVDI